MNRTLFLLVALLLIVGASAILAATPAQPALANGSYGILGDETDRAKLPAPGKNTAIVVYDPKVSDPANKDPKRYLLVPTVPDVPMSLAGDPTGTPAAPRGRAALPRMIAHSWWP